MHLNKNFNPPSNVQVSAYTTSQHGIGIVHLGAGAFHRAHQAIYTDDALARHGGDWRILGVSLRSTALARNLELQDGLYTLVVRSPDGNDPALRIVSSIAAVMAHVSQAALVMQALAADTTRIVSLTITEKAYGIDRATGRVLAEHSSISHDLLHPESPTGAIGLIVNALRQRRVNGVSPFTVLCCDNLPNNGCFLAAGVVDFASRIDPALADWIRLHVAFPNTMVDRITPAVDDALKKEVEAALGVQDFAPVETERFTQWVVEDNFPTGRPRWESGGAVFVSDVRPFEHMKLRMLNGTHSLLAYAGFLANCAYVRDVMRNKALNQLVQAHMHAAAQTLDVIDGFSYDNYAAELSSRFSNPNLAHSTFQIAMDGTQKLPQRLLDPAVVAAKNIQPLDTYAFAVAAWMRYCKGVHEDGTRYDLQDPRQKEISQLVSFAESMSAAALYAALASLPELFPKELLEHPDWSTLVVKYLDVMIERDMQSAIDCVVSGLAQLPVQSA